MKSNNCKICKSEFIAKWKRRLCDTCLPGFKRKLALSNSVKISKNNLRWAKNHIYAYHANGYIMIKIPKHPFANKRGYVYSHRLEMERHLKRYLSPIEVVHHKDGNKLNNNIKNLVMFKSTNEHTTYHLLNGDVGFKNSRRKKDALRLLQSREI